MLVVASSDNARSPRGSSILAQQLPKQAHVCPPVLPLTSPFLQPQQVSLRDCVPNTWFSQRTLNLQEARATGLWRAVRTGGHSIDWKVAWDAWVRPWLHRWGSCMSEADIIWVRSVGKEREHPSGFISDLLWVTDEWRPKAGWPERAPCFPHPSAAERWSGGGGSQWCRQFCYTPPFSSRQKTEYSPCPPFPCAPLSLHWKGFSG